MRGYNQATSSYKCLLKKKADRWVSSVVNWRALPSWELKTSTSLLPWFRTRSSIETRTIQTCSCRSHICHFTSHNVVPWQHSCYVWEQHCDRIGYYLKNGLWLKHEPRELILPVQRAFYLLKHLYTILGCLESTMKALLRVQHARISLSLLMQWLWWTGKILGRLRYLRKIHWRNGRLAVDRRLSSMHS